MLRKLLLIDSFYSDHAPIKLFIEQYEALKYAVHHFNSFGRALAFLQEEPVDIILMAIGVGEYDAAERFFNELQSCKSSAPVLILSRDSDFEIAKQYVEAGADNVLSRERFLDKPEDLIYALDFAMMRSENQSINTRKVLMNFEREHYDDLAKEQHDAAGRTKALHMDSGKKLKETQVIAATKLKEALVMAAASLKGEQARHAAALKEMQAVHLAELRLVDKDRQEYVDNYRQVFFWMHGGYSMEEFVNDMPETTESTQLSQQAIAASLKLQQEAEATDLAKTQEKQAAMEENENSSAADSVLCKQEQAAVHLHSLQEANARKRNS